MWYQIGAWTQVLADTDASIFCGIRAISDRLLVLESEQL